MSSPSNLSYCVQMKTAEVQRLEICQASVSCCCGFDNLCSYFAMAIGFIGPGFSAIASVCSLHECRYLRRFHMYFTFYILYLAVCRTFLDVDMIYAPSPSVINVDIFSTLHCVTHLQILSKQVLLNLLQFTSWCGAQ